MRALTVLSVLALLIGFSVAVVAQDVAGGPDVAHVVARGDEPNEPRPDIVRRHTRGSGRGKWRGGKGKYCSSAGATGTGGGAYMAGYHHHCSMFPTGGNPGGPGNGTMPMPTGTGKKGGSPSTFPTLPPQPSGSGSPGGGDDETTTGKGTGGGTGGGPTKTVDPTGTGGSGGDEDGGAATTSSTAKKNAPSTFTTLPPAVPTDD